MTTTRVGIVGVGYLGSNLARLCVAAGADVLLANSRGPESLTPIVEELGSRASAADITAVGQESDLVVVAIPFGKYASLPPSALSGKVVVDAMNYFASRDGQMPALDSGETTATALVQSHLSESVVVKAFNNIDFLRLSALARPDGHPERTALPVAGDTEEGVGTVGAFMEKIGFDPEYIGDLSESWRIEPGSPAYVEPYMSFEGEAENFYERLIGARPVPVSRSLLRSLLADAERTNPVQS
ncbi:NADPH-dependent F420 reductase [Leifsonia sp. NPDC056665]|uniref:NADPH-dependent F420 reductase n=1 Tax=Leifsonia sp. NPDC056665 TaxID=3345901 RepID=UPI0036976067